MKADLTDAELDELADLLDATPAPLAPLDLLMLDGYLAGVLVQPSVVGPDEWLAPVFDTEGRVLPEDTDAAWLARCTALIERRKVRQVAIHITIIQTVAHHELVGNFKAHIVGPHLHFLPPPL